MIVDSEVFYPEIIEQIRINHASQVLISGKATCEEEAFEYADALIMTHIRTEAKFRERLLKAHKDTT